MTPLWAINPTAFDAFMRGMMLELKASLAADNPYIKLQTAAGPVDDARRGGLPIDRVGQVAVISLAGPMVKKPGFLTRYFGFTSTQEIRAAVRSAVADDEVQQIVLRIDSPGGMVDGTLELANEVRAAAKVKPVIAQVDGMAASAAYWVASQASKIVAGRMDLVGSIGVIMMVYDFSAMFEQVGIRAVPIVTGPYKAAGAQGTELTADQEAYFQTLVDDHFQEFKRSVQLGRGLGDAELATVADGRVFSIPDAVEAGLVDRIQTLDETFTNFRQQAARRARLALRMTA